MFDCVIDCVIIVYFVRFFSRLLVVRLLPVRLNTIKKQSCCHSDLFVLASVFERRLDDIKHVLDVMGRSHGDADLSQQGCQVGEQD